MKGIHRRSAKGRLWGWIRSEEKCDLNEEKTRRELDKISKTLKAASLTEKCWIATNYWAERSGRNEATKRSQGKARPEYHSRR